MSFPFKPNEGEFSWTGQSNAVNQCDNDFGPSDHGAVTYTGHFFSYRTIPNYADMNGRSLAVPWQPTDPLQLFQRKVAMLKSFPNNGHNIDGWVHGESDAAVLAYANAYETNLTTHYLEMLALSGLSKENLRFVIVLLNAACTGTYTNIVRTAQTNVATAGDGTQFYATLVNCDDLMYDGLHYDPTVRPILGARCYTAANGMYGLVPRTSGL